MTLSVVMSLVVLLVVIAPQRTPRLEPFVTFRATRPPLDSCCVAALRSFANANIINQRSHDTEGGDEAMSTTADVTATLTEIRDLLSTHRVKWASIVDETLICIAALVQRLEQVSRSGACGRWLRSTSGCPTLSVRTALLRHPVAGRRLPAEDDGSRHEAVATPLRDAVVADDDVQNVQTPAALREMPLWQTGHRIGAIRVNSRSFCSTD
jgi:hypothetical protein